jgi:hypothetical protein
MTAGEYIMKDLFLIHLFFILTVLSTAVIIGAMATIGNLAMVGTT